MLKPDIDKARAIVLDGFKRMDNIEEAQGGLLFLLEQYDEGDVVALFLKKFCKEEKEIDNMITYQDYIEEIVLGKVSKTLDTSFPNIVHGAIGLCTEAGELLDAFATGDIINIKEELGDVLWYLTLIFSELSISINIYQYDVRGLVHGTSVLSQSVRYEDIFVRRSSQLLDVVKKGAFYGKGLDRAVLYDQLCRCHAIVAAIARDICNCTMDEIMRLNTEKLRKRYAKNFTTGEAYERNLDEERKALELG